MAEAHTEASIGARVKALVSAKDAPALRRLLTDARPFFATVPKAKTAKIVKNIIDAIAKVPNTTALQMEVCREQIAWATAEKRTFLRQRIELRLAVLLLDSLDYAPAVALITRLLGEVKRLDDKLMLVDIHLVESRAHHALRNFPKAKAALTAARTAANSIYVPPLIQAHIDMQSGVLNAEEKDYKTSYSYFFEAFEQLAALDEDVLALRALKYMLLSKVMGGGAHEVANIAATKGGVRYGGAREVEALKTVAAAYKARSLKSFEEAKKSYGDIVSADPVLDQHLKALYGDLLRLNLLRLLEPYSRVEVAYLAQQLELSVDIVEAKLNELVLDGVLSGVIDEAGNFEVFPAEDASTAYDDALATLGNLDKVVSALFQRSAKLMA